MSKHNYEVITTHGTYRLTNCTQGRWTLGLFGPRRLIIGDADGLIVFAAPADTVVSIVREDCIMGFER